MPDAKNTNKQINKLLQQLEFKKKTFQELRPPLTIKPLYLMLVRPILIRYVKL